MINGRGILQLQEEEDPKKKADVPGECDSW